MRLITRILALLCFAGYLHAQTLPICSESCTLISTTGTSVVYQFGANGKINTVTNPTYPLKVDCSSACPQLGGDPLPGVVKTIYAVEQSANYQVVWQNTAGVKTTVTVPAKTLTVTCTAAGVPNPPSTTTTYPATCKFQ